MVASILPMGVRTTKPQKIALPSGEAIELIDDLWSSNIDSFLVAVKLFPGGSLCGFSIILRFTKICLSQVIRTWAWSSSSICSPARYICSYTNISTYLTVIQRKPSAQMFAAQLSADTNTNREIIHNFQQKIEGASVELGRFVACESFTGITAIRTAENWRLHHEISAHRQ